MDIYKSIHDHIWVFDVEYVPDIETGRRVYRLDPDIPDHHVLHRMYMEAGATEDNPKPMLKLFFYKVMSISAMIRNDGDLRLWTLAAVENVSEADIITRFLNGIGKHQPQLVGWASSVFDLNVLIQRALILGCQIPQFCRRPDKPWEGPDYWAKFSDYNVDLMNVLAGPDPKSRPRLDEIALACGIPGKLGMTGADVADAWFAGKHQEIINYNETDVCTTYLLWLRTARMSGHVSDAEYAAEINLFRSMMRKRIADNKAGHLKLFLDEWDRLNPITDDPEE